MEEHNFNPDESDSEHTPEHKTEPSHEHETHRPFHEPEHEPEHRPEPHHYIDNDPDKTNVWAVISAILGIIVVILLIMMYTGRGLTGNSITGNVISKDAAGKAVLDFANAQGANAELVGVEEEEIFYKVTLKLQGQNLPVYITKDGEYFTSSLISLSTDTQPTQTQQEEEPNWTIFENSLPDDLKNQILSFELEEPKETENQRISEFESYQECENTLIVFYHSGCGWCTKYHPVLEQAKEDYPDLNIYALVLSEEREVAEKYGARGTPANIINCKYFASGYMDEEALYEVLDNFINP